MGSMSGALAAACLLAGAFHLLRVALAGTDGPGEVSYAAMGIGMAAMFSPVGNPVPVAGAAVVFALCGAWFAAVALRSGAGARRSDAVHHVIGSGAMLFMLLGAHPGHAVGPGGGPGLASLVAIVLAGYLAWHVLRCADRLLAAGTMPAPAVGALAARARVLPLHDSRAVATVHATLAAAMAVMVLGMV